MPGLGTFGRFSSTFAGGVREQRSGLPFCIETTQMYIVTHEALTL